MNASGVNLMGACPGEGMEEKRKDCELEFARVWDRLNEGNKKFDKIIDHEAEQDIEVATLKTHIVHLISSMSGLTKAIWGMVASILLLLIGFFIWYVQTH